MKRNIGIAIAAAIVIVLAAGGIWFFAHPAPSYSGPHETITVGTAPVEMAALIYIAEDRGFFPKNGLDVTIKEYDSALSAVAGMERGDVDLAVSTEYPLIAEVFGSKNISIIGSVDRYQTTYLVGMKDRGIGNISDFAGKNIGVTRRSIGEFYLGQFLNQNGIQLKEVTLTDIKPAQVQRALSDKSVDAAIIWNIDPETIQEEFGSRVVVLPAQSRQPTFGVLSGRNDQISGHAPANVRFLRSLDDAEQYIINHPAEAKAIVQRRINASDSHMNFVWPRHQFGLTLDQSLITAMEFEARWMIANNLTNVTTVPDFGRYAYTDGLEAVKPGSVHIIG